VLYNLQVFQDIRPGGTIYLCKEAIDALCCSQLGFEHPVAVAGVNNFKAEYFAILKPYKLIIVSDKDGAAVSGKRDFTSSIPGCPREKAFYKNETKHLIHGGECTSHCCVGEPKYPSGLGLSS
jgi:hypothetical protein